MMEGQYSRCKIVVVGDTQCGKTALLHVFAKDSYPESYVPTVFENYTASFEIDKHRIELNMWDTSVPVGMFSSAAAVVLGQTATLSGVNLHFTVSALILQSGSLGYTGSSYYDNVRPLAYPDSDAVLVCFDISRPETLDSIAKKWQVEAQEYCPNAKLVLVGCKLDMRTDFSTLLELSKQRLIPGSLRARELGAVAYVECSARVCVNSVRDVFHITTLVSVRREAAPSLKRSTSRRALKGIFHQPLQPVSSQPTPLEPSPTLREERAKSCIIM
ncbi:hypothetical protein DNTS_017823 [Danionella cerebrum]|uniref:Rho family GTPase 2 n=1 Tax=Danionella cerebrum TaxID=2873325 RepID=A0A553R069_9TELE|nr:hypothetical protein DNTS_017823 [Danionella translucida]